LQEFSSEPTSVHEDTPARDKDDPSENTSSTPSVASLLSQLRSTSATQAVPPLKHNAKTANAHPKEESHLSNTIAQTELLPSKDLHRLDFDASMPHLLQLSREPVFVEEIKKVRYILQI
jgi:hypothetical protein